MFKRIFTFATTPLLILALSFSSVFLLPQQSFAASSLNNWTDFGGDNTNSEYAPTTITANLALKSNPLVSGYTPLAVYNGRLYCIEAKGSGKLVAVDLASNTIKWQYTPDNTGITWVMAKDGVVYLTTPNGLYAIQDTGDAPKLIWSHNPGGDRIIYDDTTIYYMGLDPTTSTMNRMIAVDMSTGTEKWNINIGNDLGRISGPLTIGGGRIFFGLNAVSLGYSYSLCAVDVNTGKALWTTRLGPTANQGSQYPVYSNGKVYIDLDVDPTGKELHQVEAFDSATGVNLWKYNVTAPFTTDPQRRRLTINQDSVFLMNTNGYLVALNKDTGAERWKVICGDITNQYGTTTIINSNNAGIATNDKIFVGVNGRIKIFDTVSGTLLRDFTPGSGGYAPVAIADGMLIVTDGTMLSTLTPVDSSSDTTKPTVTLGSMTPPRFSPYEKNRNSTQETFTTSEDASAKIEIVDKNGATVRHLDIGFIKSAGWSSFQWDGRDDNGNMVLYGKYHYRITLTDLAGNTGSYEFTDKTVTVGDILGTVLQNTGLMSSPAANSNVLTTISAGKRIIILDESGGWYKTSDPTGAYTGYVLKSQVVTRTNPNIAVPPPQDTFAYTIQKGDTLYKIAILYGVTVNDVMSQNHITNPNTLYVGQVLSITVKYYLTLPIFYTVQPGDTLWLISQKNHVTMDSIIKINNLTSLNNLYVGQRLQITQ